MFRSMIAGAILVLANAPVFAATVIHNGTAASNILGLELNGLFYDITFEFVEGSDTNPISGFGSGDIFADNGNGAQQAVNAINAALKDVGIKLVGQGTTGNGANTYIVPYSFNRPCDNFCAYRGFNSGGSWVNLDSDIDALATIEFARFVPATSAVPVPPALYLFASGLIMLGAARKRRGG